MSQKGSLIGTLDGIGYTLMVMFAPFIAVALLVVGFMFACVWVADVLGELFGGGSTSSSPLRAESVEVMRFSVRKGHTLRPGVYERKAFSNGEIQVRRISRSERFRDWVAENMGAIAGIVFSVAFLLFMWLGVATGWWAVHVNGAPDYYLCSPFDVFKP